MRSASIESARDAASGGWSLAHFQTSGRRSGIAPAIVTRQSSAPESHGHDANTPAQRSARPCCPGDGCTRQGKNTKALPMRLRPLHRSGEHAPQHPQMRMVRLRVPNEQRFYRIFLWGCITPGMSSGSAEYMKVCGYNKLVNCDLRDFRDEDFDSLWRIDQQCFAPGIA